MNLASAKAALKCDIVGNKDNYKYLVTLYTHHFRERFTFSVLFFFPFLRVFFWAIYDKMLKFSFILGHIVSTRRTSPWNTSPSLKLAGLSSGRDSISSSRQKGKSLLTGKVLSAVQAKNEFNLSGSCRKGCWLGFNMRWIIRHTSFGL